jgi:4-amino-4-deoxy-L-arabinose transferase-like glycosyltransferase
LMGLLAVVDTFLIYKIAEVRYNGNRKVAFVASILFAVMPISWLTRRIVLDSILMPFLLSAILFAVYYYNTNKNNTKNNNNNITSNNNNKNKKKNTYLILLSGIFLGLAIFTKIPAFTMIPLVGFLIISAANNTNNKNQNNNNSSSIIRRIKRLARIRNTTNLKALGLWFIPVILIPLIWPVYAISVGQFDSWSHGVVWQATERQEEGKTFLYLIDTFFRNDPILLVVGGIGLIFAATIKKDLFLLLWAIPFLIFIYLVGWVTHFHLITLLPVFCISAAILIIDLLSIRINKNNAKKGVKQILLPFAIISAIGIFGLLSTIMLITTNISSSQFEAAAFVAEDTQNNSNIGNNDENQNDITIISSPIYSWIFKYAFHKEDVFSHIRDSSQPIRTEKIVLMVDSTYKFVLSDEGGEEQKQIELMKTIDKNTYTVANFRDNGVEYDKRNYPYTSMREAKIGGREIDVQANY